MKTVSIVLVVAYAALNIFLAVAGPATHRDAPWPPRLAAAALFLLAAAVLGWGGLRHSTPCVLAGLVVASVAPVAFGAWVEHSNVLLHHAVRALVASVLAICWALAFTSRTGGPTMGA